MTLRLRLLVGLAALVLAALAALAIVTTVAVRHNLLGRLDSQLSTASASLSVDGDDGPVPAGRAGPGAGVQPGGDRDDLRSPVPAARVRQAAGPNDYVEYLGADGTVDATILPTVAGGAGRPALASALTTGPAGGTRVLTVSATGGGTDRVAVTTRRDGSAVAVAAPLTEVSATVRHLVEVEAGFGLVVLVVTLGFGVILARHLTRPLEQIALTADAISSGDLTRRVPGATDHSEVGRVGAAINAMLASIAASFARRDATEARLRQFVADASHELATPLTSIRGYAELFERGLADRPGDLRTAMSRIEAEARRMGGLVDELLLLARLDASAQRGDLGQPAVGIDDTAPVDLAVIAADTAADLRAADPSRPVHLHASEPVRVIGDEDRLRQVAANLAANARRHTPSGTAVHITAATEHGRAILRVADAGGGLAPEDAARVFERFFRVDPARARSAGGTGLGLAIVAAIAAAHGGRAEVASTPGAGTTFTVILPVAAAGTPRREA